jgi:hypothetical protein
LPSLSAAREHSLYPAVKEYAKLASEQQAKVVMYSTYGYFNGTGTAALKNSLVCPKPASAAKAGCYADGKGPDALARLSGGKNGCGDLDVKMKNFPCMTYDILRAYLSTLSEAGADVVAPCGAAWHVMRGAPETEGSCMEATNAAYNASGASNPLEEWDAMQKEAAKQALPKSWSDPGQKLYRSIDPKASAATQEKYCDGCNPPIDHHPSILGSYLNALVFYTTVFRKSPVGAAIPDGVSKEDAEVAQKVAEAVVLEAKKEEGHHRKQIKKIWRGLV